MTGRSGDIFTGKWVQGLRDGQGIITTTDNGFFEGYFAKDKAIGKGVLVLPTALTSEQDDEQAVRLRIPNNDPNFKQFANYQLRANDVVFQT